LCAVYSIWSTNVVVGNLSVDWTPLNSAGWQAWSWPAIWASGAALQEVCTNKSNIFLAYFRSSKYNMLFSVTRCEMPFIFSLVCVNYLTIIFHWKIAWGAQVMCASHMQLVSTTLCSTKSQNTVNWMLDP
jgi:hypothetical protein